MPERQDDNNGIWKYPTAYPGANLKMNPNAVRLEDGLVESVGTDGRFIGAIRPFPGMADTTIHGVPKPSGSTTITSLTNIVFAKYAAVQKGLSNDLLKGIVYIADNPGATGKAVYFAYRDSSSSSSNVVLLENLFTWTDFKLTSYLDYDLTSMGKYIYAAFVGDTTSTVTELQNKKPPYNKAYFWDFKINDWDGFVSGFDNRFMSVFPERLLTLPFNTDNASGNSSDAMRSEVYSPPGTVSDMPDNDYTYAIQLVSRKHGLRSPIRYYTLSPGTLAALRYRVGGVNPILDYGAFIQQVRGNSNERTPLLEWGLPHADGFRVWRGPGDDLGMATGVYAFANVYEIDNYIEFDNYPTGSGAIAYEIDHDIDAGILGNYSSTVFSDPALVTQPQFDAYLDHFGPAPRLKRLTTYDGLLVGIVDADEPSVFNVETQENEQSPEAIVWSTLTAPEPENFPPENYYRVDNPAERFYALEPAGDHLFGITNASVYRISRSGGTLVVNKLTSALGGVSRYGATGVGGSLFIVTPAGVKELDGNTGEVRSLSILDRVILDDSEWAGTLASVFVEYDAKIGALIFLNTSLQEAYILWESTGAVTKVEDCPWTFLTSGPDVLTDGPQRTYFITDAAAVMVIDGARQMGKRSMCGTTISETVNGTCTSTSSTNLVDTAATFPANIVGFRVYILSGVRTGESAAVTVRNSGTNLSITGLSGTLTSGDRYSVSPVLTRITLPQLVGQGGDIDPFVRKTVSSISCAFSDLAGEYTGVNGKVTMGVKQNLTTIGSTEVSLGDPPDQCVGRANFSSTRALPYLEFKGGNLDFELQAVLVKGVLGISEAQTRQV